MTANDMADALDQRTNRVDAAGGPGFLDAHYSRALTEAMWYHLSKYISAKTNLKREGFEESEIRGQGFSALIKTSNISVSASQAGVHSGGVYYDLPTDFMVAISESPVTSADDCTTTGQKLVAEVEPVSHDDYRRMLYNPYRRPRLSYNRAYVWRMYVGRFTDFFDPSIPATAKRCELIIPSAFTITQYRMDYLKIPPNIVVNRDVPNSQRHCILDASTHEIIVDIATKLLKRDTDQQSIPDPIPINEYH